MTMKAEIIQKNVDFLLERAELMARQATEWANLLHRCERGSEEYYVAYGLAQAALEDMKLAKNDCKILLGLIQKAGEG